MCERDDTVYMSFLLNYTNTTCLGFTDHDVSYSLYQFSDSDGIIITYGTQLTFELFCSEDDSTTLNIKGHKQTGDSFTIYGESPYACPYFSGGTLWDFISTYKIPVIIVGILVGLVEAFFGQKLFKFTIFVLGFLAGSIPTLLLLFGFFNTGETWQNWVMLFLGILAGIALGSFVVMVQRLGFLVAGGVLGFFIAIFLNSLVIYKIPANPPDVKIFGFFDVFV
jgi:Domain of unknown function (DUF4203)